jgi:hypothetical protein
MRRRAISLLIFATLFAIADVLIVTPGPHDGHGVSTWHGPGGAQTALAQVAPFLQPFDVHPAAPQAFKPSDWDVQTYEFFVRQEFSPVYQAEHGAACDAPPTTHAVTSPEDAVFLCNDHLMTTINGGYGAIFLTPNQLVDFSAGEAVIRFDVSTDMHSIRDWFEIGVTPYDENVARTGDFDQGPPRHAVKVLNALDAMRAEISRDFVTEYVPVNNDIGWSRFYVPSASRRDTFEIHLSRTHLKVGLPAYNQWWIDRDINDLGWSRGILQISQHSYSATKGCIRFNTSTNVWESTSPAIVNGEDSCPNTWHWDNISISPAIPFTIVRADRRYVEAATPELALTAPAPPNSFLRFAALGTNLELTTDGGTTWQTAQRAATRDNDVSRWRSYWTPIPAGTTGIRFRGEDAHFEWIVEDVSAFSLAPSDEIIGEPGTPNSSNDTDTGRS